MKTMTNYVCRWTVTLSMTLLSISFLACNSSSNDAAKNDNNSADTASEHNEAKFNKIGEKDAQAVVDAYNTGLYEIRLADSAKKFPVSKDVRALTTHMSEAFTMFNAQLNDIASKKQISLPTNISSDEASKIMKLKDNKVNEMDMAFAKQAVDKGKDAITMFDKNSKELTDPDIKTWFLTALPELRKHLDMAMTINDKLEKKSK